MVVRVYVENGGSAGEFIQRLLDEVEAGEVSLEAASRRICVDLGRDPDQAIARVLRTVDDWLVDLGGSEAKVEIDGHAYTLEPAIPVGGSQ